MLRLVLFSVIRIHPPVLLSCRLLPSLGGDPPVNGRLGVDAGKTRLMDPGTVDSLVAGTRSGMENISEELAVGF